MNDFAFDALLTKQVFNIILRHSNTKPAIIFCATRKDTLKCAKEIAKSYAESNKSAWNASNAIQTDFKDRDLNELVPYGVAFHHAGLDMADRSTIEKLFLTGSISVITATSTLAVGVNLPAHLVIIKNTLTYVGGSFDEYSDLEILQMIGRAGRPQFDDSGTAVILTEQGKVLGYENLVSGTDRLESCLHDNLLEHINAEIGLGTFKDVSGAIRWLKSTFLYVRIKANPAYYHVQGLNLSVDEHLEMLCEKDISLLEDHDLVNSDGQQIKITVFGDAMAKYYVRFVTMCHILNIPSKPTTNEILVAVCKAEELATHRFRTGEKPFYNELKKNEALRYTFQEKTDEIWQKIMILSQLDMCNIDLSSLKEKYRDVFNNIAIHKASIRLQLMRLLSCVIDCKLEKQDATAVSNALELRRSFAAKCWENHPSMLKQLTGIGEGSLRTLMTAGIASFDQLRVTDPRELERIFKRNPPFGNGILKDLSSFPSLKMQVTLTQSQQIKSGVELTFFIRLLCENQPRSKKGGHPHHIILLADTLNGDLLDFRRQSVHRITDGIDLTLTFQLRQFTPGVRFRLMCEELVGNMVQTICNLSLAQSDFPLMLSSLNHQVSFETPVQSLNATNDVCHPAIQAEEAEYLDIFDDEESIVEANRVQANSKSMTDGQSECSDKKVRNPTPVMLPSGRQACNHHCKDKNKCGHVCCKDGVAKARHKNTKDSVQGLTQPINSITQSAVMSLSAISIEKPATQVPHERYSELIAQPDRCMTQESSSICAQDVSNLQFIDLSEKPNGASRVEQSSSVIKSYPQNINLWPNPKVKSQDGMHHHAMVRVDSSSTKRPECAPPDTSDQVDLPNLCDIVYSTNAGILEPTTANTPKDTDELDEYGWSDSQMSQRGMAACAASAANAMPELAQEESLTSALFLPTSPETQPLASKLGVKIITYRNQGACCTMQDVEAVPSIQHSRRVTMCSNASEGRPDLGVLDFLGDCFVIADDDNDELPASEAEISTTAQRTVDIGSMIASSSKDKQAENEHRHHSRTPSGPRECAMPVLVAGPAKPQKSPKGSEPTMQKRPFSTAFPQTTIARQASKAKHSHTTNMRSSHEAVSPSTSPRSEQSHLQKDSFAQLFHHSHW